jgi:hypothetical protein
MSTAASRTRTPLVAAAAAAMGIGIAAAPAAAVPGSPPILPPNPIRAHESAAVQLATHLADRAFPNDPVRVVTDAFSRFNTRFNGGIGTEGGASVNLGGGTAAATSDGS